MVYSPVKFLKEKLTIVTEQRRDEISDAKFKKRFLTIGIAMSIIHYLEGSAIVGIHLIKNYCSPATFSTFRCKNKVEHLMECPPYIENNSFQLHIIMIFGECTYVTVREEL